MGVFYLVTVEATYFTYGIVFASFVMCVIFLSSLVKQYKRSLFSEWRRIFAFLCLLCYGLSTFCISRHIWAHWRNSNISKGMIYMLFGFTFYLCARIFAMIFYLNLLFYTFKTNVLYDRNRSKCKYLMILIFIVIFSIAVILHFVIKYFNYYATKYQPSLLYSHGWYSMHENLQSFAVFTAAISNSFLSILIIFMFAQKCYQLLYQQMLCKLEIDANDRSIDHNFIISSSPAASTISPTDSVDNDINDSNINNNHNNEIIESTTTDLHHLKMNITKYFIISTSALLSSLLYFWCLVTVFWLFTFGSGFNHHFLAVLIAQWVLYTLDVMVNSYMLFSFFNIKPFSAVFCQLHYHCFSKLLQICEFLIRKIITKRQFSPSALIASMTFKSYELKERILVKRTKY